MKILVAYKNGTCDEFTEEQLDKNTWTIRGHAGQAIQALVEKKDVFKFDAYNCIVLAEVISIRVV